MTTGKPIALTIPTFVGKMISAFYYAKLVIGEGNGNPLQYSCLEIPWTEEPGGLQSMELQKSCTQLSILKSRDITLPIKIHLVKAMVFSVVMYGCESWTIKKAER